jgi:hypothetical protein
LDLSKNQSVQGSVDGVELVRADATITSTAGLCPFPPFALAFSSLVRWAVKWTSAKRKKMKPRTGAPR